MKLNTYKNYRVCNICEESKPLTRDFFSRNSRGFFNSCKKCIEDKVYNKHWKDGLLFCPKCESFLPTDNFNKNKEKTWRSGYDGKCRKCKIKDAKDLRAARTGDRAVERIITERFLGARDRARKNNIIFTITKKDILNKIIEQEHKCAISKLDLTFSFNQGRVPTNASIDKIIPNLGYTKENIQIVCMAVNQMKNDLDMNNLLMFCREILKNNTISYENKN